MNLTILHLNKAANQLVKVFKDEGCTLQVDAVEKSDPFPLGHRWCSVRVPGPFGASLLLDGRVFINSGGFIGVRLHPAVHVISRRYHTASSLCLSADWDGKREEWLRLDWI